jgi:N-acetyl-anhydromuramyl-L-alanine amidase AmpD
MQMPGVTMADPLTVELGPGHVAIVAQWMLVLAAVEQMCALHDVAAQRQRRPGHAMTWQLVDSASMPSVWARPLEWTIMNLRRSELLR